jgi:hypothetical protein
MQQWRVRGECVAGLRQLASIELGVDRVLGEPRPRARTAHCPSPGFAGAVGERENLRFISISGEKSK